MRRLCFLIVLRRKLLFITPNTIIINVVKPENPKTTEEAIQICTDVISESSTKILTFFSKANRNCYKNDVNILKNFKQATQKEVIHF